MARVTKRSAPNMADSEVMDGIEIYFTVKPDEVVVEQSTDPSCNTEVADPDAVKMKEKVYVQSRLFSVDEANPSDSSQWEKEPIGYDQLNTTNFPNMTQAELNTLLSLLKKVHDQHRSKGNLDPSV